MLRKWFKKVHSQEVLFCCCCCLNYAAFFHLFNHLFSIHSSEWDGRDRGGNQWRPHQPGNRLSRSSRPDTHWPAWHCQGGCKGTTGEHWRTGICTNAPKNPIKNNVLGVVLSPLSWKPLLLIGSMLNYLQIKRLIRKFITKQETISLVVVPCNVDIATTEALKMAQEVDPDGERTLGKNEEFSLPKKVVVLLPKA